MASCREKKLAVHLNRKKLPIKDFRSYLGLLDIITPLAAFERIDKR
jgi:hypothetical protein